MKKRFFSLALFFFSSLIFSQTPSIIENIRFPLWAQIDAFPETAKDEIESSQFGYPIKMIKKVAPFLVGGMVYGWEFTYTPSDKMRNVQEFFEVKEIQPLEDETSKIRYDSPWLEDERLYCWVNFTRNEFQVRNYYQWYSIQNPAIHGRGYGSIAKGFDGIQEAAEDALKNAVRKHFQSEIKNKPKEISGQVLIRQIPTLGIISGKYVMNLDFFIESVKIVPYTVF